MKLYAVVEVSADGVNPDVYIFDNKETAREFLKELWAETKENIIEYNENLVEAETWYDSDGDCARITFEEDDWIYYQVVDAKMEVEL